MKKLRNLVALVVLSLPLLSANAAPLVADAAPADLKTTHGVTDYCWIYFAGRWWVVPC